MHLFKILLPLSLIALAALVGCSGDDAVTDPIQDEHSDTSLIHGRIDDSADFEFMSAPTSDRPGLRPGPFLIRGFDVRYDDGLGALLVDLTVTNAGEHAFPKPASLSFVSLLPETVEVRNADNGEMGPGAMFELIFENEDAQWTPGEESLPFTVQFGVAQGTSIGFVARVDVGMVPGGGAIGGLVWHDLNEDGLIDLDESGLAEVGISLAGPNNLHHMIMTGPDGEYRFDGLPAGYYTVTRLPRDDLQPTTPPQVQVLLVVDEEDEITDFIGANFGCLVFNSPPGGPIQVGDCVHLKGDWENSHDALDVDHWCYCGANDSDKDGTDCWESLSGPVTSVDLVQRTVSVMGSVLHLTEDSDVDLDIEGLAPGDRVRVNVEVVGGDESDELLICRIRPFEGNWDRVRGLVQRIGVSDQGLTLAMVLGIVVDLTGSDDCVGEDD